MTKLVLIKLGDGNWERGFSATLQIAREGEPPSLEITGRLPADPEIPQNYDEWQWKYRHLPVILRLTAPATQITNVSNAAACRQALQNLRENLNHWLNSESFRPLKEGLLEKLHPSEPIRFIIQGEDRYLRRLPWHLWDFFDRYSQAELAISPTTYQESAPSPVPAQQQVRILAILGSSEGIDVSADRRFLEHLPGAETEFLREPERPEISQELWQQKWDIFFFAGHSHTEGEIGRIYLNNRGESLTLGELKYGLKTAIAGGLQLAIFNSCDGLGLAKELEDLHVPQAIVMREPVPDKIAQKFLQYFLEAFSQGRSLYLSVRQARERLADDGEEQNFPGVTGLPVIVQNPAQKPPTWTELTRRSRGKPWTALWSSLAVTALVLALRSLGGLQPLELKAYDGMVWLRPQEPMDERLLVITIDEEDFAYQDKERMKRHTYQEDRGKERQVSLAGAALSQLLTRLEPHKPIAIGLDILRDFPSREDYPPLTQQLQQIQNLFVICKGGGERDSGVAPPPEFNTLPDGHFSSENRVGFNDVVEDYDGVLRRYLWSANFGATSACLPARDASQPAFSLLLAQHYLKVQNIQLDSKKLERGIWETTGGKARLQAWESSVGGAYRHHEREEGYQMMLNYRNVPKDIAQSVPLKDVLNEQSAFKPESVRDKIVLIGVTAEGIDEFSTPLPGDNGRIHGVFIHAHAISQILSAELPEGGKARSLLLVWHPWAERAWIFAWAIVGGFLAWRFQELKSFILAGGIAACTVSGVCYILFLKGWWVPYIPSLLGLAIAAAVAFSCRLAVQSGKLPSKVSRWLG